MPHSGYTICTSEQRPTSTTVSRGFVVEWYSSPPFGSQGPCKHSKPCPLDFGPGHSMQDSAESHLERIGCCLHHALVVSNDVSHPTRKLLRLLGPCFKTGREQHCKEGAKLRCRFLARARPGGGTAEYGDHRQRRCSPRTASTPRIRINHWRPTRPKTHRESECATDVTHNDKQQAHVVNEDFRGCCVLSPGM